MENMKGLLDVLQTPQGLGLLMSGVGSAFSGDPRSMNSAVGMLGMFEDLNLQREMLKERARKKDALAKMPGILGDLQAYPTFAQPQKKQEAYGLLADVAPETMMAGLFSELSPKRDEARTSTLISDMERMGIPVTLENYERLKAAGGERGGLDLLQQAQLAKIIAEMQATNTDRATAADDKAKTRRAAQVTLNRNLDDINQALELVDKLEGSIMETGVPFGDARRALASGGRAALAAMGVDKPEWGEAVEAYDKLNKTLSRLVVSKDNAQLGTMTDSKLDLIKDAMGSTEVSPAALRSVLLDGADTMLDTAEIEDYTIANRDALVKTFSERRRQKSRAPKTIVDVPKIVDDVEGAAAAAAGVATDLASDALDFAKMSLEEISKLTVEDIDKLTAEQLRAMDARIRKLGR